MHLLTASSTSLDEIVEAVDLGQTPGDIVVLSFADSDLAALAAAWEMDRAQLPSIRLAHLRDLRHPMSVDLWVDRVAAHAKVILVRLLGGAEWWKYGIERLSALARTRGIALAVLPGEDRNDDRLAAASTLSPYDLDALLRFSVKAAATICADCCGNSRATPVTNSKPPSRNRCRVSPAIFQQRVRSIWTGLLARCRPENPSSRFCFTVRYCLLTTRPQSMRFAMRCRRAGLLLHH
jgi:hypothetical protein